MTEPTGTDPAQEPTEPEPTAYTPPATQADLDRIIADRVKRTKAQFGDYAALKAAKTELDQIKAANQTAEQRQAEELSHWQADAEKWRTTAVGSRVQALASTDFADPDDAVTAIGDLSRFLDAGGQIDDAGIRSELAGLLERKPHWRRQESTPPAVRPPAPNPAQGRGGQPASDPAAEFASILQGQLGRP